LSALAEERGGGISNSIFFVKIRPKASVSLKVWRGQVPAMNCVRFSLDASAFSSSDATQRIKSIVLDFVAWSGAVYATALHSSQAHYRIAQRTPLVRLQNLDWLTFFGEPYIGMFGGRERIRAGPWYSADEVPGGLLLLASARPEDIEMTESVDVLLRLEEYLGGDAFAGRGFPEKACRVPVFDLSETVTGQPPPLAL